MDVHTFLLKSYVTDLLELRITLDCSVSYSALALSLFICKSCLKTVLVHLPVVAEKFHTLALEGIPVFGLHNRTAAYRFVTLVDVCKYPLTYTVSSIFSNQNHSSNLTMG